MCIERFRFEISSPSCTASRGYCIVMRAARKDRARTSQLVPCGRGEKSKTSGEPYIPPTTARVPPTPFFRFRPGLLFLSFHSVSLSSSLTLSLSLPLSGFENHAPKMQARFSAGFSRIPAHPIFPPVSTSLPRSSFQRPRC